MRRAAIALGSLALVACGLQLARPAAIAPAPGPKAVEVPAAASPAKDLPAGPIPALLSKAFVDVPPAAPIKGTLPAADLGDVRHLWQTLNNCGPASVVMALSTFGITADQEEARLALRGADVRRGMSPVGVDPWVREQYGLRAMWRNDGTNGLLKSLISNGFAPVVTQWMEDPSISRIAHWRTIVGYDDAAGTFYSNDPMRGRHVPLSYEWVDRNWQPFSYRYLVIYRPEDEDLLKAIVGPDWSEATMRQRYYDRARQEAVDRNDSPSWLALGEAAYQAGRPAEAVAAFERGMSLGSAAGVFTLRSSYPQALRALGRGADAAALQQKLGVLADPAVR